MLGLLRTFIEIILTVIEFLLSIRFALKFFEISASNQIIAWLYKTTASLVAPFAGIVDPWKLGKFSFDFTTLIALVAYLLAGKIILKVLSGLSR
jgi:uncharacterized protein YggT (Ycf19 family)